LIVAYGARYECDIHPQDFQSQLIVDAVDRIFARVNIAVGVVGALDRQYGRDARLNEGNMIAGERLEGGFNPELRVRRRSLA
jgi:hypothetical protein